MKNIQNLNIREIAKLPSPDEFIKNIPLSNSQSNLIMESRKVIENILTGKDDRILLLVGPCSIHDRNLGIEYAKRLRDLAEKVKDTIYIVMRVYFEKPRTTVGWKGLINDPDLNGSFNIPKGIELARNILSDVTELGMPTATEFLDPFTPQYIGDLVSWGAIGARTAESQTHRQMASGLSMPIGFKNGTGGSVQLAIDGMIACLGEHAFLGIDNDGNSSVVITKGNPANHVILRGGASGTNYDKESVRDAQELLEKNELDPVVVIDCAHGNSNKDHNRQPIVFKDVISQRMQGNKNIVGLMIESNINPGNQTLGENLADLDYGVSITDKCVGWEKTEEIILEASKELKN